MDSLSGPRDVAHLRVPPIGEVCRVGSGPWEVLGADGQPVVAWVSFRSELVACGCSASTCRSYAHDVLRWLRFLAALGISWQQASRVEVRDFVRWLRVADNPARCRGRRSGGRPAPGSLNAATGKAYLAAGYAPRPSTTRCRSWVSSISMLSMPAWARCTALFPYGGALRQYSGRQDRGRPSADRCIDSGSRSLSPGQYRSRCCNRCSPRSGTIGIGP